MGLDVATITVLVLFKFNKIQHRADGAKGFFFWLDTKSAILLAAAGLTNA